MTKKVKDIYFKDGLHLPFFVMQNGETKSPYQMGNTFYWLTNKEFTEFSKQVNDFIELKKPWYKKLFKK